MLQVITIAQALRSAAVQLKASSSPRLDAEVLLAESLAVSRASLYRESARALDTASVERFQTLIQSRASGKPVPYLTGRAEFWSLEFEINDAVLVPRPETELLVELALEICPPDATHRIAELGTGSGAVAAAIALERPLSYVVAIERSLSAVQLAHRNLHRLGAINAITTVADWLSPFTDEAFDLIVANPPYVAESEREQMDPTLHFEPREALFAGHDGLSALATIIVQAPKCLVRGGHLIVEHGDRQGRRVDKLFRENGFQAISTRCDLAGCERVSLGVRA